MTIHRCDSNRLVCRGFSLLELIVVVGAICVLLGFLLPAVRRGVPHAARRTACSNQIRQIALAALNYEYTHGYLPAAMGGIDSELNPSPDGAKRMSGLVALLPFLEQGELWNQISNPMKINGIEFPAMPAPWLTDYPPWQHDLYGSYICPSTAYDDDEITPKSYAFCIGDQARNIHTTNQLRGVYGCSIRAKIDDITDGASNTIGFAEIGAASDTRLANSEFAINQPMLYLDNPEKCFELLEPKNAQRFRNDVELSSAGRGSRWADGAAGIGLFNTILPPGSPSIAIGPDAVSDGIFSAGSFHKGGINVAFCDGSVSFIRNSIDAGDLTAPTPKTFRVGETTVPSPYGVWGALGTANGEEIVDDQGW